jgi:hypothetical protein
VSLTTVLRISSIGGVEREPRAVAGGSGAAALRALHFSAIAAPDGPARRRRRRCVTTRERGGIDRRARSTPGWSEACPRGDRLEQRSPSKPRSAAMMFAFVIALAGIAVLGAMNLAASAS